MKSGNLNLQATHFTGKESVDPSSCCKIVALGKERFSLVEGSKIQPNCRSGIGCFPCGGRDGCLRQRKPLPREATSLSKPLPQISRKTRRKLLAFKENCSFLVLRMGANTKGNDTILPTRTTKQKRTNNGFRNTEKHPEDLCNIVISLKIQYH